MRPVPTSLLLLILGNPFHRNRDVEFLLAATVEAGTPCLSSVSRDAWGALDGRTPTDTSS
jgi:hypothetical protein